MAYFFLTNNQNLYKATKNNLASTEFIVSFDFRQDENIYALATHKLEFNNTNAAQHGNDFCIAIGTCIYDESLNYEKLLEDFNGDVSRIRENTIGQYGVCIKKGNSLTVYGDACGCYNIYYWSNTDGTWMISSSLYHMAEVLEGQISLDDFAIAERAFYKVLLNGRTFFNEIHRLRGTEMLFVDLTNKTFKKKRIPVDFPIGDFNDMVEKAAESYRHNARIAAKVLGKPKICATGGLDSRIILAAFLSVGIKPVLFYGHGNNIITAPKNEDIIILKKMNKSLGLELESGDFSVSAPIDKDWDRYIKTNGFRSAYMWGSQRNVIESLNEGNKLLMFGWGGEYLRRSWYHLYNTSTPSVDVLLKKWHEMPKFEGLKKDIPNHETIVKDHFIKECEYLGINPDNTFEDDIYLLEIAWGAQADAQIPSFMQQYKYCYLMSFEYNIQRYRVTASERDNAKFMLAVMNKLYPQLLKEPIFTHESWVTLDKESLSLVPYINPVDSFKNNPAIKKIKKSTPSLVKRILHPFALIIYSFLGKKENETYRPDFEIKELTLLKNKKNMLHINNIYHYEDRSEYALLCRALNRLGY